MALTLRIFRYDGYFCFTREDRVPGEVSAHGQCCFILPVHATIEEPPEEPGHIAVYDPEREKWFLCADHRGETWFTYAGMPVVISRPGLPSEQGYHSAPFAGR